MSIDLKFVEKMFTKYSRHLRSVEDSINRLIEDYTNQIENLEKLDQKKYGQYKRELIEKRAEAFKKLTEICPNIEKMQEHILEIQAQ